jgi:hypothetical protein
MPESAIASVCIDFILSPEDIALEIKRIVQADSKTNKEDKVQLDPLVFAVE